MICAPGTAADTPIILGGMVPEEMELSGKDYSVINAVHEDTPNRKRRTAFVPGNRNSFNRPCRPALQRRTACMPWDAICGRRTRRLDAAALEEYRR